jgi:ribA/ribD-fused uncharacterized protein
MTDKINGFEGKYHFLSNFYVPALLVFKGEVYPSSEHAFQAAKTLSRSARKKIRECSHPRQAKILGRRVPLRPNWEHKKKQFMFDIVWTKFSCNPHLLDKLLKTEGSELIEDNWWGDTYWGVCNGVGENWLGRILMKVRDEIIQVYEGGKLKMRPVNFPLGGIRGPYEATAPKDA